MKPNFPQLQKSNRAGVKYFVFHLDKLKKGLGGRIREDRDTERTRIILFSSCLRADPISA